jgi:hypothetical protein
MAHRAWLTGRQLEAPAALIEGSYRGYLANLEVLLARAFENPDPESTQVRVKLENETFDRLLGNQGAAVGVLSESRKQALEAGVSVVSEPLQHEIFAQLELLSIEGYNEVIGEILAMAMRDQYAALRAFRTFAIETHLGRPRYGKNAPIYARREKVANLQFKTIDKAGRRWDTATFLRNMVRGYLVQLQADSAAFAISQKQDLAKITWPDGRPSVTISLSGKTPGYPTYKDARDELFHPNSTAMMEPA